MEKAFIEASGEMTARDVGTWRSTALCAAGQMQTLLSVVTEPGPRENMLTRVGHPQQKYLLVGRRPGKSCPLQGRQKSRNPNTI